MFGKLEIFNMAQNMATHAAGRHTVVSQNIANADTPGYRAQDVASFASTYSSNNSAQPIRATRAGHLSPQSAAASGARTFESSDPNSPNGNSVSLELEMVKASEIRQQHELALSIYSSSLGILRASLGRS